MKPMDTTSSSEISLFSRYLLGRSADPKSRALYEEATAIFDHPADTRDDRILAFARSHPWSLAALDGALALTKNGSPLRQRLLTAAAILETRPAYCDLFLPVERSKAYFLFILFVLLRAAYRAIFGLILLRFIR